jgi:hypothetical protein
MNSIPLMHIQGHARVGRVGCAARGCRVLDEVGNAAASQIDRGRGGAPSRAGTSEKRKDCAARPPRVA